MSYNSVADMPVQYRTPYGTTPVQREIMKGTKCVFNGKFPSGTSCFGKYPSLYQSMGANNVAYNDPFLTYPGAGANTYDWLTRTNYLPSCNQNPNYLRVQRNNNPRGFLANKNTRTVRGLNFGKNDQSVWSPSKKTPWSPAGDAPYTTGFAGTNGTGPGLMGQPLKLQLYQGTYGDSIPIEKLDLPRAMKGGYGLKRKTVKRRKKGKQKKATKKTKKTKMGRRVTRKQAPARVRSSAKKRGRKMVKPGDIIKLNKKGKIQIVKRKIKSNNTVCNSVMFKGRSSKKHSNFGAISTTFGVGMVVGLLIIVGVVVAIVITSSSPPPPPPQVAEVTCRVGYLYDALSNTCVDINKEENELALQAQKDEIKRIEDAIFDLEIKGIERGADAEIELLERKAELERLRNLYKSCPSGQTKCGRTGPEDINFDCVDLQKSRYHCGECRFACHNTTECSKGECTPVVSLFKDKNFGGGPYNFGIGEYDDLTLNSTVGVGNTSSMILNPGYEIQLLG